MGSWRRVRRRASNVPGEHVVHVVMVGGERGEQGAPQAARRRRPPHHPLRRPATWRGAPRASAAQRSEALATRSRWRCGRRCERARRTNATAVVRMGARCVHWLRRAGRCTCPTRRTCPRAFCLTCCEGVDWRLNTGDAGEARQSIASEAWCRARARDAPLDRRGAVYNTGYMRAADSAAGAGGGHRGLDGIHVRLRAPHHHIARCLVH